MVNQADEPLTKVTLNLFTSDVEFLKAFTENYTVLIRDLVRQSIKEYRQERYDA